MITKALIDPQSICVVGASDNLTKPGGKILRNILAGNFSKPIYVVHPYQEFIQNVKAYKNIHDLPECQLAILVVSPIDCLKAIEVLLSQKNTKAIIIISAGFSELSEEGKEIENKIVHLVNAHDATLIGPNCIGVLNKNYYGVFTTPIPDLTDNGCDLISSSGATAVFLMEAAIPNGLKFSNVFSVGNGAQTTVADILEYLDENYIPGKSAQTKLIYIENILYPAKLLKHAQSLIRKGCRIAAIKSGSTPSGSRAAASHTGAMANPDMAVKALFKKAGIVMCKSRQELITVAAVFKYKELKGKNIAIITHAGGSAVMLTDALSKGGLNVPELSGNVCDELYTYLNKGSSVKNPIDFLATGTAEQLGIIIDYCEHKFNEIDAMIVVFGSPGLFDVENVYRVLSVKLDVCKKPIYPVLPSIMNAQREISYFLSKGFVNFPEEVSLGEALANCYNTEKPDQNFYDKLSADKLEKIKKSTELNNGFLPASIAHFLLETIEIKQAYQKEFFDLSEFQNHVPNFKFPVVAKIIGPLHKSESGGIILNIKNENEALDAYHHIMKLTVAKGVMIQEMLSGTELFIGVKYEPKFGHIILYGLGGIFVEVLEDFQVGIVPVSKQEVKKNIRKLKGYKLFQGIRGKQKIDEDEFADCVVKISQLVLGFPEITEIDLNPLIATKNGIFVVDSRIKVSIKDP